MYVGTKTRKVPLPLLDMPVPALGSMHALAIKCSCPELPKMKCLMCVIKRTPSDYLNLLHMSYQTKYSKQE